MIKKLVHKGENWNGSCASGSSFGDLRIGCAAGPKSQEHENFEKYDFAIKKWDARHNNSLNILFLDGHIQLVPYARVPDNDETSGVWNTVFFQVWKRKVPPGW